VKQPEGGELDGGRCAVREGARMSEGLGFALRAVCSVYKALFSSEDAGRRGNLGSASRFWPAEYRAKFLRVRLLPKGQIAKLLAFRLKKFGSKQGPILIATTPSASTLENLFFNQILKIVGGWL